MPNPMTKTTTPPPVKAEPTGPAVSAEDADLVDRIFAYMEEVLPGLLADPDKLAAAKDAVREEFGGRDTYVRAKRDRRDLAASVLAHFNGRNATEVARKLRIGRATVYRVLKQSGKD